MGQRLIEGTLPRIAEALGKIADSLEEIRVELKRARLDKAGTCFNPHCNDNRSGDESRYCRKCQDLMAQF